MKLVKLSTDDIVKLWSPIRISMIRAMYPAAKPESSVIQKMQCRLLVGEMQCWCIHNEAKQTYGYIVTSIESNMLDKYLFICSEYLNSTLPTKEDFYDISDSLAKFATVNDCSRIVAYSSNKNAISIAEKLGYNSDFRILTKEV